VLLVTGAARLSFVTAALGLVLMVLTVALQGAGHKSERVSAVPFRSPLDFLGRFFVESWINFPRFVFSGGWARAFAKASR
jgi:hypothetical protein